jgi:hypothetical protein
VVSSAGRWIRTTLRPSPATLDQCIGPYWIPYECANFHYSVLRGIHTPARVVSPASVRLGTFESGMPLAFYEPAHTYPLCDQLRMVQLSLLKGPRTTPARLAVRTLKHRTRPHMAELCIAMYLMVVAEPHRPLHHGRQSQTGNRWRCAGPLRGWQSQYAPSRLGHGMVRFALTRFPLTFAPDSQNLSGFARTSAPSFLAITHTCISASIACGALGTHIS